MKNKVKKSASKRNLVLSGISMIVCLIMIVGAVFAWFTVSQKPQTGRWSTSVITDPNDKYKDVINIYSNNEENELQLSPGNFLRYKISLKNNTNITSEFKLLFETVLVRQPIFHSDINYSKYLCDIYDVETGKPYELLEESGSIDPLSLLRAFSRPVSNAVSFYYGLVDKEYDDLIDSDAKIRKDAQSGVSLMKLFGDQMCDPSDPEYMRFVGSSSKVVCKDIGPTEFPPDDMFEPEWITLDADESVDVYFLLYFDPFIYSTCTFGGKEYEMRNSNCFLRQELRITFGLEINEL